MKLDRCPFCFASLVDRWREISMMSRAMPLPPARRKVIKRYTRLRFCLECRVYVKIYNVSKLAKLYTRKPRLKGKKT